MNILYANCKRCYVICYVTIERQPLLPLFHSHSVVVNKSMNNRFNYCYGHLTSVYPQFIDYAIVVGHILKLYLRLLNFFLASE